MTTTSTPKPRFDWPDVARGVCMVLVVLWHSASWVQDEVYGGPPAPWVQFGLWVTPLRMPLFFFISGYFSATLMARPLRTLRRRTWGMYYLYVVWTFIFLCRLYLPQVRSQGPAPTPGQMLTALVLPTSFWYFWCLAAFFVLTYAVHRFLGEKGKWLILPLMVAAALAPLVRPHIMGILVQPMDAVKAPSAIANYVWFFAGTYLRPLWDSVMRNAKWSKLGLAVAGYAAVWVAVSWWNLADEFAWQLVPLAILALYIAAQALALLPMKALVPRILKRIGQDTLPVYVFHIFGISVISAGTKMFGLIDVFRNHLPNLAWVIPPVMVAFLIPATLGIAWLIRKSPFRFLLHPPAWLVSPDWPKRRGARLGSGATRKSEPATPSPQER